jgi:hypothetical protein
MSTTHIIYAELDVKGCTAEIYVNGLPITRLEPDTTRFEAIAAEEYVIPEENTLELLVEPGSRPSLARTERRDRATPNASAVARLVRYPDGVFTEAENGEILAEIRWEGRPESASFPQSISRPAPLERRMGLGRWAWQDAPPLTLDDALIHETRAVLDEVARAIRSRDAGTFWRATEIRVREGLRAYPAMNEEEGREELAKVLAYYGRSPDPVIPLRPERHDFRLVAGDRVLQCIDDDWTASLKLKNPDGGDPVPYPLFLSRIDGRLQVVR